MQHKVMSIIEAVCNSLVSFITGMITQIIIFPFFGIHISVSSNAMLVVIFMAVSFVRSYVIRRAFATISHLQ